MVRQRKKLKSGRAGGDGSEHTVALSSCPNTRSPLVALPAEIQSIITSYVNSPLNNAVRNHEDYFANGL